MRVIVSSRVTGKTTRMVNYMLSHPEAVCVVHSAVERDRLEKTYGISKERFILPHNVLDRSFLRGRGRTPLVIDNLDLLLAYIFDGNPIELVTMTADLVKETEA